MAKLTVYNQAGDSVGDMEIDWAEIASSINKQLLHDVVVMYQANARMGSHRSKSRGEVRGNNQKMYRQKGTGRARAGGRRSGVRVGGGHIHAVRPRDYSYRLPRKAIKAATRMAIAAKLRDEQVVVVEGLSFDAPSTKQMAGLLNALPMAGQTTLVVTAEHDANTYKSARNIAGVSVTPRSDLNAYCVLRPRRVIFAKAALEAVREAAPAPAASE